MSLEIDARVLKSAEYIVEKKCTIRKAASVFGVSKSTVFTDMSSRLPLLNYKLYEEVKKILEFNLEVRHLRGGESTRRKFKTYPKDCCVQDDKLQKEQAL